MKAQKYSNLTPSMSFLIDSHQYSLIWSQRTFNIVENQHQKEVWGFPGGAVVKNPPAYAGDTGSSPGLRRSHMPRSN